MCKPQIVTYEKETGCKGSEDTIVHVLLWLAKSTSRDKVTSNIEGIKLLAFTVTVVLRL